MFNELQIFIYIYRNMLNNKNVINYIFNSLKISNIKHFLIVGEKYLM